MKLLQILTLVFVLCMHLASATAAPDPVARTVTDSKGRAMEVTLLSADSTTVKIRRKSDRQEFALAIATLSKADQDFIVKWREGKAPKTEAASSATTGQGWSWSIKPQYQAAGRFQAGIAPVKLEGKWGFINESGKMVISPRWLGLVDRRGGSYEVIGEKGKEVIQISELLKLAGMPMAEVEKEERDPSTATVFRHGLTSFREIGKYGVKNAKGEVIAPAEWTLRPEISLEGAFLSNSKDLNFDKGGSPSRFIDPAGKTIFDQPIGVGIRFSEGLAAAWKDLQHLGFIDVTGKFVLGPFKYTDNYRVNRWGNTDSYRFSEGLAAFPDPAGGPLLGYMDKTGKFLILPKWHQAQPFSEGMALVSETKPGMQEQRWQVIDKSGRVLTDVPFEVRGPGKLEFGNKGYHFRNGCAMLNATNGVAYGIDRQGKVIKSVATPEGVRVIHQYAEQGVAFVEPGTEELERRQFDDYSVMQLVDQTGRVLVPPGSVNYHDGNLDIGGLIPSYTRRRLGAVGASGNIIVSPEWEFLESGWKLNGLIKVSNSGEVKHFDLTGKPIAGKPASQASPEPEPQNWKASYDRRAKKWGFKDASGKFVLGPEWEELDRAYGTVFKDGLAGAKKEGRWGFIDRAGKTVIEFQYERAGWFTNGLAAVRKDGKFGYVDSTGKLVIPCQWDGVEEFKNGMARVNMGGKWEDSHAYLTKGGRWGAIDKSGKLLVPAEYTGLRMLSRQRAWVAKEPPTNSEGEFGSYALLNTATMQPLTPFEWRGWKYDGDFSEEGLLLAENAEGYGYLDENGKVLIKPQWERATQFKDGFAIVWKRAEDSGLDSGLINTKGEWIFRSRPGTQIIPPTRHRLTEHEGFAVIEDRGSWGFVRIHPEQLATINAPSPPPPPLPTEAPLKDNAGTDLLEKLTGTRWKKVDGTSVRVFGKDGTFASPEKRATFKITGSRTLTITFSQGIVIPCRLNEDCTEMVELEFDKATWRREP